MRLPGRIAAAIEVLADMEARKRPASEALKGWALDHRFAGAGDRAAIGNLVYDALRRKASHAHVMGAETPRALVLAVAVRDWGESVDGLNALFAADRFGPEPVTEAEAARLAADDALKGAPEPVLADVPAWLLPELEAGLGADWLAHARSMTGRPPLDMRVNTLKSHRDKVARSLARFSPLPTAIAPEGLRIPSGPRDARTANVQVDEGYQKGWFEIQDEGSQIVAALAGAAPGEQVLDLCAGAGGKTLAMAAAMGNSGQIFAYDSDRSRLAPIHERLKRAGARNVQVRNPEPGALDALAGRMDRVVVDAPCTGSGTWRRRPDTKWKLTPAQLAARVADQQAVLAEAARHVRPGGELAYITCSLLGAENGGQIARFLAAYPAFSLVPMGPIWAARFGGSGKAPLLADGPGLTLTPAATETDGFYIALLRNGAA